MGMDQTKLVGQSVVRFGAPRLVVSGVLGLAMVAAPAARAQAMHWGGVHLLLMQGAAQQQAAENTPPVANAADTSNTPRVDPRDRPLSDKEKFRKLRQERNELSGAYKTWLTQDVAYIITDEEAKAFKSLGNDEERDAFIEQFWQRRNPNPDSADNEFREEHYRRIAYANEHFAAGKPGWKTDRGRIYITWGKPDSIDSHPSGGSYQRPMSEGGGETETFPFEVWHYRYLEGVGDNIDIEFVDTCQCGDFHFTLDRSEKDALLHVPGAGLTLYEEMGQAKKADRFKGGIENLGNGPLGQGNESKEFDRIEMAAKLFAPPPVKFRDLDAFISEHKILTGPVFPFDVRTDYVRVTDDTMLVPITLQIKNKDVTFTTKDGVSHGVVEIEGRVSTITDRAIQTFEDTVEITQPQELLGSTMQRSSVYWKALPLRPGMYRLDIAVKDVNNKDHIGIYARSLVVPKFDDEKLATSSMILADKMEQVPTQTIGTGNFIIGNTYIRPRVSKNPIAPVTFTRDQRLNCWMQVYNLGINDKTKSNEATVTYEIQDGATDKVLLATSEQSKDMSAHSDQLTMERTVPLAGLQPGKYKMTILVNDAISKQQITRSVPFVVE